MARLLFKDEQGVLHTVYGVRGVRGDGIANVELTEDYELEFTTDDGVVFTTGCIRGPQGAPGRDGLPDGDDGNVIVNLMDDDGEFPVTFRSSAWDVGVVQATEQLGFDNFTYNPSEKVLTVGHVEAQVSDSISAVTSTTEGDLESGDSLRDLFGKIRRKFSEIKDFVKNDLATTLTETSQNVAASAAMVAALKTIVDGKSDIGHKHDAGTDITTGILPAARGGTGASAIDSTPTASSNNMVTSGGVKAALDGKAAASHNHDASNITSGTLPVARGGTGNTAVDTTPTANSTKMVTSGGVKAALDGKAASSHNHDAGNITSGTLAVGRGGTGVTSLTGTDYGTAKPRQIYAGTGGMTAGSSNLENGRIYLQYE